MRRILILILILVSLFAVAEWTGLRERASLDQLRALTTSAGAWGALLYVVVFAVAQLAYFPGTLFVAAAVLSYGRWWGGALGWLGATVAVCITFAVVRGVGGRAPPDIRQPLLRRILAALDARPRRSILLLRTLFWMSPPLNYALALSRVRFVDYALASAVGLALPCLLLAVFIDRVAAYLSS